MDTIRGPKSVTVAIPVRDEAKHIARCLTALSRQSYPPDLVVLLLNNCTDGTEKIARTLRPDLRFGLHVACCQLLPHQSSAGHARRRVMALGARKAGLDGVLMTTDADAEVPPDWVRRNLAWLLRGADAVCGQAVIDPVEAALLPPDLIADEVLERRLIGLLDDMAWQIDPDQDNPPPRHTEASGASIAVHVAAFDRAGGIPAVPCGEDRAFIDALRGVDARIRHDPAIRVMVSGRVLGRAAGGMAETLRRRMVRRDEFADPRAEPAEGALRRLTLRRRTRFAWSHHAPDRFLAEDLAIDPVRLARTLSAPFFGKAWAELESVSPLLRREAVRFVDLPAEIEAASALLRRLSTPELVAAE